MTENLVIFNPSAPVNDNYKKNSKFINDAYDAILELLFHMEEVARESTAEKRDVVNAIADIAYRCNKFLEDI